MDKKYIPSALVLYLNYFIHGIGCSILSQQVVKEMLASQWGLKDVMAVTSIAAAFKLWTGKEMPIEHMKEVLNIRYDD